MKKTLESKTIHKCDFCEHTFTSEKIFMKHSCRLKLRWNQRDLAPNRLGFQCWLAFYKKTHISHKNNSVQDFIRSPYFNAFVKFGLYCVDTKVINPMAYVDWLLASNVKIDYWNKDTNYTKFLVEYLRLEDPYDSIARSVEETANLLEEQTPNTKDFFRLVSPYKICQSVTKGKISPWVLYQSDSGIQFLSTLTEDNVKIIIDYIDPEKWNAKFLRDPKQTKQIKQLLKDVGF